MDKLLEIHTLLVSLVAGNLLIAAALVAYLFRFPKDRATKLFIAAKSLQGLSWLLVLLRDKLPGPFAVPASNALILFGGWMEVFALLSVLGLFTMGTVRLYAAISAFGVAGYLALYVSTPAEQPRIVLTSVVAAVFIGYPAVRMICKRTASPLQLLLGGWFGFASAAMLLRAAAAYAGRTLTVFTPEPSQELFYFGMYAMMIIGTAGFILLSREQSYVELERVATFDELTGILNRRSFLIRAQQRLDAAARRREPVSFLLLDIDHFKRVNDTFGHDAGDRMLRSFADTVNGTLRDQDLFGRFGGEEFAILLTGTDAADSDRVAEAVRLAVSNPADGEKRPQSVSIGVITVNAAPDTSLNMLYKLSDTALYQAKKQGRNRVVRGWPA